MPTFRTAHYRFTLTGPEDCVDYATSIFDDLLVDDPTEADHRWVVAEDDEHLVLRIDDFVQLRATSPVQLVHRAVPTLTRKALDERPDALHLHAMAVRHGGEALVVAGASGAGKSTLCATLVQAGAAYMTDEAVAIDPTALTGQGYRKPIVVKRHSFAPVSEVTGLSSPDDTGGIWEIPASRIGSLAPDEPHVVSTIVSYAYDAGSPPTVEPMHRAGTVHALLSDALDAGRFGSGALVLAGRLAAQATCLRASANDAQAVAAALLEAHGRPVEPGEFSVIGATGSGTGARRAKGIASVVIDGRVVLYDTAAQRVVELDELVGTWWQLFDGTPTDELVAEVAEATGADPAEVHSTATRVIDELAALRLLDVG